MFQSTHYQYCTGIQNSLTLIELALFAAVCCLRPAYLTPTLYPSSQGGDSALLIERGVVDVAKRKMTLISTNVTWRTTVQFVHV